MVLNKRDTPYSAIGECLMASGEKCEDEDSLSSELKEKQERFEISNLKFQI